jgi:hypothetical protein
MSNSNYYSILLVFICGVIPSIKKFNHYALNIMRELVTEALRSDCDWDDI